MKPSNTVLLVDDDVDFAVAMRTVLESAGLRVFQAGDPGTALELASSQRPDLLITDLMMDGLDAGLEFIAQARTLPGLAHVPALLVTAVGTRRGYDLRPRDEKDLRAMGIQAFLEKPVPSTELVATVQRLLAERGNIRRSGE